MGKQEEILEVLPRRIQTLLKKAGLDFEKMQEIRMRIGRPLQIVYDGQGWFLNDDGEWSKSPHRA